MMPFLFGELADALGEGERVAKGRNAKGAHQARYAVVLFSPPVGNQGSQRRRFLVGDARRVPPAGDASLGQEVRSISDVGHGMFLLLALVVR
jgi:hypothetical protein